MHTLVVIRHGESEWNQKNLFCGWTDVYSGRLVMPAARARDAHGSGTGCPRLGDRMPAARAQWHKRLSELMRLL